MEPSALSLIRKCLICGAPTTSVHYGVDACRACTVFYRKARRKKPYACREDASRCSMMLDGVFACKRCRFDRFESFVRQSSEPPEEYTLVKKSQTLPDLSDIDRLSIENAQPNLLDKCAICYKMMCAMRRNGELNARPSPPPLSKMHAEEYEILPTSYGIMNTSSRFYLTAILDFAEAMFPEFSTFSEDERWKLAVSYYYRIFLLDSAIHAEKVFPDDLSKSLGNYTAYMSVDIVENFFDDCPNQDERTIDEAKKVLNNWMNSILPSSRVTVRQANLDDVEFHAVLMLTFWIKDCMNMRDEIAQVAERYRQQVLRELQAYYRDDLRLTDCAARIGELFMLIFNMERGAEDCDENFEIYRMLGVFTDDTFVYRLHNRNK